MYAESTSVSRRPPRGIEQLYLDSDVAVGATRDLFIVMWRDRTTRLGVSRIGAIFEDFCSRNPSNLALLTIVESGAKPPESDAREPLALLMRSAGKRVVISAVVFEQTGFMAAAFRGVVTSLCLIARQAFSHRMFSDVESAARWVERTHHGRSYRANEICSAVSTFRLMAKTRFSPH